MFNRTGLLLLALVLLCGMLLMTAQSGVQAQDDPIPTTEPDEESTEYSFAWPIETPTEEQIETARNCNALELASERYLDVDDLPVDDFADAYPLEEDCDWAALIIAYVSKSDNDVPPHENTLPTLIELIERNPVLVFHDYVYDGYIGNVENLVEPPPFAAEEITSVTIYHTYSGLGSYVKYEVMLEPDGDIFTVRGDTYDDYESDPQPFSGEVTAETVQALAPALSDLMPIVQPFDIFACFDNYPDWEVTIAFADGTEIELFTEESNFFHFGGPWYTVIEDQAYVQFSSAFIRAVADLVEAAELPRGTTAAMTCGYDGGLLNIFYPPDEDEATEEGL